MAATGEPYSVAARALDAAEAAAQEPSAAEPAAVGSDDAERVDAEHVDAEPVAAEPGAAEPRATELVGAGVAGTTSTGAAQAADPAGALAAVIACATRTLTASSARVEIRDDTDTGRDPEPAPRRPPGLIGRLAGRAARAAWDRVAPDTAPSEVREMLLHQFGAGFIEPAGRRYLIDFGGYAQVLFDGRRFGGLSGQPLGPRHEQRPHRHRRDDPLDGLGKLQRATAARWAGTEQVRWTTCRVVVVVTTADDDEFTVWIDDEHVRRFQTVERGSGRSSRVTSTETVELWDFGVAVDSLDWSRLPSFRTPR
jgi:hypothetical protein